MRKIAPLSASFMLTAMLGFFLTLYFVFPASASWGFAFATVFVIMFVASVISMSSAPVNDPSFYRELAVHNIANREELRFTQKHKDVFGDAKQPPGVAPQPMPKRSKKKNKAL